MKLNRTRGVASVIGLILAACSGTTADLSDAEVGFLSGMIPHHAQAVEMANAVADNTERPELIQMADDIVSTQNAEIAQMAELLEGADQPVPATGGMEHDEMAMDGMMSTADMEDLESAAGLDFDLMFIEMMIRHHESAIEEAEEVLATGPSSEIAELAEAIIEAQRAEITQMDQWADTWSS